jgi:uncharacterized protein YegP (UPF0339 family)
MKSEFVIVDGPMGFWFKLKDEKGKMLCSSVLYRTRESCMEDLEKVRVLAPEATVTDFKQRS